MHGYFSKNWKTGKADKLAKKKSEWVREFILLTSQLPQDSHRGGCATIFDHYQIDYNYKPMPDHDRRNPIPSSCLHGWCGGWATGCRATCRGFDSRTKQLFV
ncbi:unnamed protein product [Spodoptera exigua]|nr:unnamed protein product [Spodoptera exigua]